MFFNRNTFSFSILRFGRKRSLIYFLTLAAIASVGAVLLTMYDPGNDKCEFTSCYIFIDLHCRMSQGDVA